eukprot:TRINITY_DN32364_c0_g1_i1.p1 TRINITY_DN32364_c0_g1~~TRINITY_DN32364_c0_g1_i1.p1  ORF type:complete len:357 (+),score=106.40 TRINITY_DN32364_c0_g1_i1:160-1071(+)
MPVVGYQYLNCVTRKDATSPHLRGSHLETVAHVLPLPAYDEACGGARWYARAMLDRIAGEDGEDGVLAAVLRVEGPMEAAVTKETLREFDGGSFVRYTLAGGETYHCIASSEGKEGDVVPVAPESTEGGYRFFTKAHLQAAWGRAAGERSAESVRCVAINVPAPAPATVNWPTMSNDAAKWVRTAFPNARVLLINLMSVELENSCGCMINHRLLFGVDADVPTVAPLAAFDLSTAPPAALFPEADGARISDFLVGEGFAIDTIPVGVNWLRVRFTKFNDAFMAAVPEARDVVGIESCSATPVA